MNQVIQGKSVSFNATLFRAPLNSSLEPLPQLVRGQKLLVRACMPDQLKIEDVTTRRDIQHYSHMIFNPFGYFIADGTMQLEMDKVLRRYVRGPAASRIEDIKGTMGLPSCVFNDMIFTSDFSSIFANTRVTNWKQQEARVYTRRMFRSEREVEQKLVVALSTGLPITISEYRRVEDEPFVEILRVNYSAWEFNKDFGAEFFSTLEPGGFEVFTPPPC